MKRISIHPLSALAGAGILGIVLMATGATQAPVGAQQIAGFPTGTLHVAGIPDPNDLVVLREEDGLYTVPAGMVLVVTGLGSEGTGNEPAELSVNGALLASAQANSNGEASLYSLPSPGVVAFSGAAVAITSGSIARPYGRALGYLSRVRP